MAVAQSRRKDAPTQTTANARMRDSACPKFRKDAKPKEQARFDNPATLSPAQQAGYYFLVRREGEPATCGSCKDAYKQQLIQFFIQRVDKLQQYIAKSV
ncbi:MAG: hypothetical protein BHW16_03545 [Coprococcus sp. CAG:131-related_45_246]|nr:MAG: hypothetical protein BHW16_03545 [Coprococcus sp. CAG:131-related_45_246]